MAEPFGGAPVRNLDALDEADRRDWRATVHWHPGIENERGPGRDALPLLWADDCQPVLNAQWLVKRVLPREGLAVMYGPPGAGKTFVALDIAIHVALGREWHGHKVEQGFVAYVAAEGQHMIVNRVEAWRRHYACTDPIPLAIVPCAIDLFDPAADRDRLVEIVRYSRQRAKCDPALVVVDTISKTLGKGNENTELGLYLANCQQIASALSSLVLAVHHPSKDGTDLRGFSGLRAGVDAVLHVPESRSLSTNKQKDGEERQDFFAFDLMTVKLGEDEDGDPVTSCVVVTADPASHVSRNPRSAALKRMSPSEKTVFNEMERTLEATGVTISQSAIPSERLPFSVGKVVRLTDLSDNCQNVLRTGSDIKADSASRAYRRALSGLQAKEIVDVFGEWAWLAI